jgi:hypothetical protein
MTSKPAPRASDINYRLLELSYLMEAMWEIMVGMDHVRQDGTRIEEMDRVTAMHRIAGREVQALIEMSDLAQHH